MLVPLIGLADIKATLTRILRRLHVAHPFDFPGTPTMVDEVKSKVQHGDLCIPEYYLFRNHNSLRIRQRENAIIDGATV